MPQGYNLYTPWLQVAYVADLQDMCEELQGMQSTMTEQAADAGRQV